MLSRKPQPEARELARPIPGFLGWCLLYELSFGLSRIGGLIGNVLTLVLAAWLALPTGPVSRAVSVCFGLVVAWVATATWYLVLLIRLNS